MKLRAFFIVSLLVICFLVRGLNSPRTGATLGLVMGAHNARQVKRRENAGKTHDSSYLYEDERFLPSSILSATPISVRAACGRFMGLSEAKDLILVGSIVGISAQPVL